MHLFRSITRLALVAMLLVTGVVQIVTTPGTAIAHGTVREDAPDTYPDLTFTPEFRETDCPYVQAEIPSELDADSLECGFVTAPEDHDNPDGDTIDVFVTRIPSTEKSPSDAPLFILAGGPGQAGSDILSIFSGGDDPAWGSWTPLLEDHDAYLIDQRGTGLTTPTVICPEDLPTEDPKDIDEDDLATPTSDEETEFVSSAEWYADCVDELADEGIDLDTYTNRQSAADLDVIRQALGASRVDIIGTSYGSWLALETMRYYPDTIRSVILNSPVPPQSLFFDGILNGFQSSLDAMYDGCAADPICDEEYPDLETMLEETVADLNADPMVVRYEDPDTGETVDALADGQTLMDQVYTLLSIGPFISIVPSLIGSVADGDPDFFSEIINMLASPSDPNGTALYLGLLCQDEFPYLDIDEVKAQAVDDGISQIVIDNVMYGAEDHADLCAEWDLPPSGEISNEPVVSDIPTLIVTGKFDPITPTVDGEAALETLSNGILVESPIGGHDPASSSGTCGVDIMQAFLEHPQRELDTSCMDDLSIDFSPS